MIFTFTFDQLRLLWARVLSKQRMQKWNDLKHMHYGVSAGPCYSGCVSIAYAQSQRILKGLLIIVSICWSNRAFTCCSFLKDLYPVATWFKINNKIIKTLKIKKTVVFKHPFLLTYLKGNFQISGKIIQSMLNRTVKRVLKVL